jgi:ParB family chromosome partitioning protein
LKSRLPQKSDEHSLFAWLLEQPQAAVFELMAFCVSGSLNAVQQREKASPRFIEMAQAVSLNMCDWWKPTAADYFCHVSKARITDVITQAISAEAAVSFDKLKKTAAAEAAERSVVMTKWLPEVLRTA